MRTYIVFLSLIVLLYNFELVQGEESTELEEHYVEPVEEGVNLFCEKYNSRTCKQKNKTKCITEEKCLVTKGALIHYCFTFWEYNIKAKTANIQITGCFMSRDNPVCLNNTVYCTQKMIRDPKKEVYFCCCNGNLCNKNRTESYLLEERNKLHQTVVVKAEDDTKSKLQYLTLIIAMCTFIFTTTFSFIACVLPRTKIVNLNEAGYGKRQESVEVEVGKIDETNKSATANVKLMDKLAEGRFGSVWRARRGKEYLAVKIFPLRYRQSWKSELEIFRLPFMKHDNLLQYIGARYHGRGLDAEFWLITPYFELGSLYDYLTDYELTCDQMFSIAITMTSGLKHLHQEVGEPDSGLPDSYKPTVVHRDFKSKNVLLTVSERGELSACVADFGLAIIFRPGRLYNLKHGRVGTLRYMAPEVLQGAVSFHRSSFLAIDMYACGLVLWELATRCRVDEESLVEDYCLPFQKEVGSQPTFDDMHTCIVEKQQRPHIPESWREHTDLALISQIMEDCWDKDAEARLSSSCIVDRLTSWIETIDIK